MPKQGKRLLNQVKTNATKNQTSDQQRLEKILPTIQPDRRKLFLVCYDFFKTHNLFIQPIASSEHEQEVALFPIRDALQAAQCFTEPVFKGCKKSIQAKNTDTPESVCEYKEFFLTHKPRVLLGLIEHDVSMFYSFTIAQWKQLITETQLEGVEQYVHNEDTLHCKLLNAVITAALLDENADLLKLPDSTQRDAETDRFIESNLSQAVDAMQVLFAKTNHSWLTSRYFSCSFGSAMQSFCKNYGHQKYHLVYKNKAFMDLFFDFIYPENIHCRECEKPELKLFVAELLATTDVLLLPEIYQPKDRILEMLRENIPNLLGKLKHVNDEEVTFMETFKALSQWIKYCNELPQLQIYLRSSQSIREEVFQSLDHIRFFINLLGPLAFLEAFRDQCHVLLAIPTRGTKKSQSTEAPLLKVILEMIGEYSMTNNQQHAEAAALWLALEAKYQLDQINWSITQQSQAKATADLFNVEFHVEKLLSCCQLTKRPRNKKNTLHSQTVSIKDLSTHLDSIVIAAEGHLDAVLPVKEHLLSYLDPTITWHLVCKGHLMPNNFTAKEWERLLNRARTSKAVTSMNWEHSYVDFVLHVFEHHPTQANHCLPTRLESQLSAQAMNYFFDKIQPNCNEHLKRALLSKPSLLTALVQRKGWTANHLFDFFNTLLLTTQLTVDEKQCPDSSRVNLILALLDAQAFPSEDSVRGIAIKFCTKYLIILEEHPAALTRFIEVINALDLLEQDKLVTQWEDHPHLSPCISEWVIKTKVKLLKVVWEGLLVNVCQGWRKRDALTPNIKPTDSVRGSRAQGFLCGLQLYMELPQDLMLLKTVKKLVDLIEVAETIYKNNAHHGSYSGLKPADRQALINFYHKACGLYLAPKQQSVAENSSTGRPMQFNNALTHAAASGKSSRVNGKVPKQ